MAQIYSTLCRILSLDYSVPAELPVRLFNVFGECGIKSSALHYNFKEVDDLQNSPLKT